MEKSQNKSVDIMILVGIFPKKGKSGLLFVSHGTLQENKGEISENLVHDISVFGSADTTEVIDNLSTLGVVLYESCAWAGHKIQRIEHEGLHNVINVHEDEINPFNKITQNIMEFLRDIAEKKEGENGGKR